MGQGVWIDYEKLNFNDKIEEVVKHGSLAIGFIGLAEALKTLTGSHHGESRRISKARFRNNYSYEKKELTNLLKNIN